MSSNDFAGKVAVVTGAAGSIGAAACLAISRRGARIAAVDRPGCNFTELARQIPRENFVGIEADVTDEQAVRTYVERSLASFDGRIDIFFNNAGVVGPIGNLVDCSLEDFRTVMSVNVDGVFLGLKYVLPQMMTQGFGSVINMSSIAGLLATPGVAAYTTSKHAVIGLTKAAAVEAAEYGIRVNCINPGPVAGRMINSIDGTRNVSAEKRALLIPARRYASPEDVAKLVAFLASDDAAYINGSVHSVDGGLNALRAT